MKRNKLELGNLINSPISDPDCQRAPVVPLAGSPVALDLGVNCTDHVAGDQLWLQDVLAISVSQDLEKNRKWHKVDYVWLFEKKIQKPYL